MSIFSYKTLLPWVDSEYSSEHVTLVLVVSIVRTLLLVLLASLLMSCQEPNPAANGREAEVNPQASTAPAFLRPTAPSANFADMSEFDFEGGSDSAFITGTLKIENPCVYIYISRSPIPNGETTDRIQPSRYQLNLPRSGTFFDPQENEVWVWEEGPMSDGDTVVAGGGEGSFSSPHCTKARMSWSTAFLIGVADDLS